SESRRDLLRRWTENVPQDPCAVRVRRLKKRFRQRGYGVFFAGEAIRGRLRVAPVRRPNEDLREDTSSLVAPHTPEQVEDETRPIEVGVAGELLEALRCLFAHLKAAERVKRGLCQRAIGRFGGLHQDVDDLRARLVLLESETEGDDGLLPDAG